MSYRRSYDYTITPEEKDEFMKKVKERLKDNWQVTIHNDYPYDMCRDKKVKTEHLTMFYTNLWDAIFYLRDKINEGYSVQINSTENQSIPEINHLHFIKITYE